jgi:hypothetical protein
LQIADYGAEEDHPDELQIDARLLMMLSPNSQLLSSRSREAGEGSGRVCSEERRADAGRVSRATPICNLQSAICNQRNSP